MKIPYCAAIDMMAAAVVFYLTGCSSLGLPTAPSAPSTSEITRYSTDVDGIKNPTKYVSSGYSIIDQQCNDFFNGLYNARNNERFAKGETLLTISTASAAVALTAKAVKTLGYIALGSTFVSTTYDNYESYSYLGLYQAQLKQHVDGVMADYKKKYPATDANEAYKADTYVKTYANLCTPMYMDIYIQTALSSSKSELDTSKSEDGKVVVKTTAK